MKKYVDHILAETRWMEFVNRACSINEEKVIEWTFARRKTKDGKPQRIVVIVPRTKLTKSFVVIKQYRVPFNDYLYEFPAGLVDEGETLEQAALRELKEETGYTGVVTSIGGPIASSAGLTDEVTYMVYVETEEEPFSEPTPEISEEITVEKVRTELIPSLLEKNEREGIVFGAKVYCTLKGCFGEVKNGK
jgi:8-oxo-dGTP pyrophosphatase MutT (NUDIX family)